MGCCGGLLRCLLFIFNGALFGAGIALLIIGGIAADEFRDYADEDIFDSKYLWGPVALAFVVGILLILVGLCGVGGLCCKNKCMLKAFIVFVLLLLVLEVVICILAFVYNDEGEKSARTGIRKAIPIAYQSSANNSNTRKIMDKMQKEFDCCGSTNISDYAAEGRLIPDACCRNFQDGCASNQNDLTRFWNKGCAKALFDEFDKYSVGLFTVCIIFVVLQIVGFILACKYLSEDD